MFKRMDEGGDACRERGGKDLVRGGKVKKLDYESDLQHLMGLQSSVTH